MIKMFGMIGMPGPFELVILGVVCLLLFGGRLPILAKDVGRSVFELRKGLRDAFDDLDKDHKDVSP